MTDKNELEHVIRYQNLKTVRIKDCAYADDVMLLTITVDKCLKQRLDKYNIKVHVRKTN